MQRLDAHEFAEWMAYAAIEPFGPLREDLRAGEIAAAAANFTGRVKNPLKPEDFFGSLKPATVGRPTAGQLMDKLRGATAKLGGKVN